MKQEVFSIIHRSKDLKCCVIIFDGNFLLINSENSPTVKIIDGEILFTVLWILRCNSLEYFPNSSISPITRINFELFANLLAFIIAFSRDCVIELYDSSKRKKVFFLK